MVFREVFLFKSYDLNYDNPTVIIDGVGNIGLTSLFLTQKFKSARIYTIEPDLKNFKVLLQNVAPYNNIVPINAALWNKESDVKIKNEYESEWAFEIVDSNSTNDQILKGLPLSYIINQYKLDRIDILKLDIEGAEKELFTDNYDSWIARTKCIVIELHDWLKKDCSKAVFKTLAQYNFDVSIFNGMLLCINRDLK
jgi:FkbM family methyltransferase